MADRGQQYRPGKAGNAATDLAWKNTWDFLYALNNSVKEIRIALPAGANGEVMPVSIPSFQAISNQLQKGGLAPLNTTGLTGIQQVYSGTHQQRVANFPPIAYPNDLFFETDRTALYFSNSINWSLVSGRFNQTQNNLTGLGLGLPDAGMLVFVSDFGHLLSWGGSAFNYADADVPGRIEGFLVDPPGNGWILCNGTNTTYLLGNGTTTNVTLPDLTSNASRAAFLLFGNNANATLNAPVVPVFTGNALAAHAHDAPIGDSGNFLTTYTLNVNGQGANYTAISKITSVADNTAGVTSQETSAVSAGTPAGTISNNGTPQSIQLRPWFRR